MVDNEPRWAIGLPATKPLYRRRRRRRFQRILTIVVILVLMVGSYVAFRLWGTDIVRFVMDADRVRAYVADNPVTSRLLFIAMVMIQVIIAVIPGEPFELGAGYAFGALEGTIVCLVGITIASVLIFLAVRKYGRPIVELFFPVEKIEEVQFLNRPERLNTIVFIVFFLPGTPKDILTYLAGLTPITLRAWLIITTIGRIPSVVTSTLGGSLLSRQQYWQAVIVFGVTALLALAGLLIYRRINEQGKDEK